MALVIAYATGEAMKSEEQVPMITPRIIAKMKLRIDTPPRKKMTSNTSKVVIEVMVVRARVEHSALLKVS